MKMHLASGLQRRVVPGAAPVATRRHVVQPLSAKRRDGSASSQWPADDVPDRLEPAQGSEFKPEVAADEVNERIEQARMDAIDALQQGADDMNARAADAVEGLSEQADDMVNRAAGAVNTLQQQTDDAIAAAEDAADAATGAVEAGVSAAADAVSDVQDMGRAMQDTLEGAADEMFGRDESPSTVAGSNQLLDGRFKELKVLVAGATGGVGRRVVEVLREKGVPVRALVRNRERATKLLPPAAEGKLEIVTGDVFQYATLPSAFGDANALVICTGVRNFKDPLGPFNIDYQGTVNLVALAKNLGLKHVVLVTSIGADELLNPLNAAWGVLFWKKRAEEELQRSGLSYTVVRPGGLKSKLRPGEVEGNIVMARPGTYGFPPFKQSGAILRRQVAEVCADALVEPAAKNKVVEVIAETDMLKRSIPELFASVRF